MSTSIIDELWLNIKQNAESLRIFLNEKTQSFNITTSDTIKPKFDLVLPFSKQTNDHNGVLYQSIANSKEFFIQNKQHISAIVAKLIGVTLSATLSYFLFKWLLNSIDPTHKEKKLAKTKADRLLKEIGISNIDLDEYELIIASNIIAPHNIDCSWNDIGGLDHVINDLRETVIYPLKNIGFKTTCSRLIQPPKGVLLFGPPGNAKTMIAKALAKESGARFINLNVTTLVDKWYGESQKRTDAIFSLARKIQPVIIFIDEIDSFLRSRKSMDHECTLMMKTQFMTLWDGLTTDDSNQILIIGATNRPQDVDPAILRRMPALFNIKMPDEEQRLRILKIILKDEHLGLDVDLNELAEKSTEFSGSDLKELCRYAAMNSFIFHMKEQKTTDEENLINNYDNENFDGKSKLKIRKIDFDIAFEKLDLKRLTRPKNIFEFDL